MLFKALTATLRSILVMGFSFTLATHKPTKTMHTAPLTAGGLSVLEALGILKALAWEDMDSADPRTTHARVEALRIAWNDRLSLLGDPKASKVPVERLLSADYASHSAERVRQAVAAGKLIPGTTDHRTAGGTIHLTACDQTGMMVALTLSPGYSRSQ